MITGNEPINPITGANGLPFSKSVGVDKDLVENHNYSGLTIRQHFAAMAEIPWNTVMNTLNRQGFKDEEITLAMVAELKASYKVLEADALINELNKKK